MNDSSHWYDSNGKAVFEVPAAKGGMRSTTIRDARKMNLYPSVTTVLGVLSKGSLDRWKLEQVALAAYNRKVALHLPQEDYVKTLIDAAFEQVEDAADLGTDIHKALEDHFQGRDYNPALAPYVQAVQAWTTENKVRYVQHELRLCSTVHGYAGTTDAIIDCPRGLGILDFKSRKTKPGVAVEPYDTQKMQIAAYRQAALSDRALGCNLYISTTEPGRVDAVWYDPHELTKEWECFESCLKIWRHLKGYDPRGLESPAAA